MPYTRHLPSVRRSPLFTIGAVMLAAWLLWLALRTMCLAVFAERDPELVAQLLPLSAVSLLHQADATPADSPAHAALLARVARIEPLEPTPYLAAGDRALARRNLAGARRQYEAARFRAPRQALVHLKLLDVHVRSGAIPEAVRSADRAMRLTPRVPVVRALAGAIASFAALPGGRQALSEALARRPRWRGYFVRSPRALATDPDLIFSLVENETMRDPARIREAEQASFLNAMIERGEYDLARLAFLNFLPADFNASGAVYDGEFRAEPGPPPFNWRFLSNAGGAAGIRFDGGNADGYLLAEGIGRRAARIATQTLTLPPGPYRLTARTRTVEGSGSPLEWRILCVGPRQPVIATLPLVAGSDAWRDTAIDFPIPPGCGAQILQLRPIDAPAEASFAIDRIAIQALRQ